MSISSAAPARPVEPVPAAPAATAPDRPLLDARFAKHFVLVCGLVPALLLAIDARSGSLGVNDVNFAIRSTGMLGLVFLTLTLCITPLRRLTGWTWLIAVRRNIGVYGCLYIAAHFAIFFWFDRDASVGSTLSEIVERVYLWFGTASLVLMIPLALTSTDGMVSRLGKRWKLLHRLTYVAVVCGVIHFYLLVKADTTRPLVFGGLFAALMLYRLGRGYRDLRAELAQTKAKLAAARKQGAQGVKKKKFWSGELRVARIFDETADVKTFRMINPDGGPLPFEHTAGQYLNISLPIDGKRVGRSYTIASSPTRTAYVEISVKRDGLFSKHLHANIHEGDTVKIGAPAGKFFFAGHEAERVILVAGGVGITPMMSVIRSLTDRCWRGEMYLLFAVRTRADVIFAAELAALQARFANLHVTITLTGDASGSPGWTGARGRISKELIQTVIPDLGAPGPVMMCGPEKMMQATRALFVELGVPDARVLEEAFVSPAAAAAGPGGDGALVVMVEPGAGEAAAAAGEPASVTFRKAGKSAEAPGDQTLLEVAEDCGVEIPFECRSGICGQCKTKLVSGRVTMDVQDALTGADRAKGLVLACQARAATDVVIDA